MDITNFDIGKDAPNEFNVIIEIQAGVTPVKYEIDKDTNALVVDRVVATSMFYPAHYGFIPQTLAKDGDPVDVLLIADFPIIPGCIIKARPVGMLDMSDEKGEDVKVLCVPVSKVYAKYDNVKTYEDLPKLTLSQIEHFFTHYKDLEEGKWVKVQGYKGLKETYELIKQSMQAF